MPEYIISLERGDLNYGELEPLYRRHYGEMQARLKGDGVEIAGYAPRLDLYFDSWARGWLLNFVVRHHGEPIGYSNVYLTHDMHNGEPIATEDTIYIVPEHRNGIGRKLAKHVLAHLGAIGVKRFTITAVTDVRAGKIWKRLGFKPVAEQMTYTFSGDANVRARPAKAA